MRTLLFAVVIALAPGCSKDKAEKHEQTEHADLPEISVDDVDAGLKAKTLTVYDCNSDKTRKKVGILPGAVLVPDEETFTADILPKDKAAKIVFYCGGPG